MCMRKSLKTHLLIGEVDRRELILELQRDELVVEAQPPRVLRHRLGVEAELFKQGHPRVGQHGVPLLGAVGTNQFAVTPGVKDDPNLNLSGVVVVVVGANELCCFVYACVSLCV